MIRQAGLGDFDSVLPLAERFFEASQYGSIMQFDPESFRRTFEHLLAGDGVCLLAEHGGRLVGMAGALAYPFYFNAAHKTGQELFWWVEPAARGSTVGARLFKGLESWARSVGCKTFSMICLDSLKPAKVAAMYIRSGYRASEHTFIKEL